MKDEMIKDYFLQCVNDEILKKVSPTYNGYISEYVANIRVSGLYTAQKLFTSDTKDERGAIYKALVHLIGSQNMTDENCRVQIECACAALRLFVDSRGATDE